jgi:hypothetical protein
LADTLHVIVFTLPANATPREAARQVAAAVADLGIVRFDLLGEGAGAAVALSWSAERAGLHCLSLGLRRPARREFRWHKAWELELFR